MIHKACTQYIWRAARQDKKPKMTPAGNYATGEYAVCLQELREQIALRVVSIPDEQLIMFLTKDLSHRLHRATDGHSVSASVLKTKCFFLDTLIQKIYFLYNENK